MQRPQCLPDGLRVVWRRDDPCPRFADQRRGGAVGWHGGQNRTFGGEVLEHLPREHALTAASCLGDEQQQRLRVALQLERALARRELVQLQPVAQAKRFRPLAVGSAEVAEEPGHGIEPRVGERREERPWIAPAEEAARMRDAKAGARVMLESGEVVEIAAVLDRHHGGARAERARLLRDRLGRSHDCVRLAGDQPCDRMPHALLGLQGGRVGPAVRMRQQGVAEVGHPACAGQSLHGGADEMDGAGRGRRQHDVDPLATDDACSRRDRRQRPADVLVGHEQASPEEARLEAQPVGARRAVQLLGRAAAFRAYVARAMDPRLRRWLELVVTVHPLRVVRRQHVRLDAQLGEMGCELQRPLDAAAARGREVERDDQDFHRR